MKALNLKRLILVNNSMNNITFRKLIFHLCIFSRTHTQTHTHTHTHIYIYIYKEYEFGVILFENILEVSYKSPGVLNE